MKCTLKKDLLLARDFKEKRELQKIVLQGSFSGREWSKIRREKNIGKLRSKQKRQETKDQVQT